MASYRRDGPNLMHNDQVQIDIDIARDLIFSQFPQYENEKITPLPAAGTVNAIFRIGSKYTARFPMRVTDSVQAAALLREEAAAMEELAECCPLPTPRPIGFGKPDKAYPMPWLLQNWIEGETATAEGLSDSVTFARDLARLVNALRSADVKGRHFDGRGRGGTLSSHDDWMEVCFSRSEGLLDVPRLRDMWAALHNLPTAEAEVMSHRDLIPANLLVRGERLVGVLDGGSFGPADPALDLVAGWHLLDREKRKLFREATGASELEWRRGAAWAFEQAMGLVWYYQETNPTMSRLGQRTISRLLDDPVV